MKMNSFWKRVLSLVLVLALLASNVPAMAMGSTVGMDNVNGSDIRFTKVDNDRVSASLTPDGRTEHTEQPQYADTDMVRVSILLEKASTIEAGFSPMGIASNKDAVAYRESLKKEQVNVVNAIERATKSTLDVVWNLTLAANVISANVPYGQIKLIEKLPGVKSVSLEQQYLPNEVQTGNTIAPHMGTSGAQIGSSLAWEAGYTGAGTRIAVIDTGTDTNHQSLNAVAFEYSLSLLAEAAGMSYEAYVESLDLLDAEEIAAVAADLNVTVDPQTAYLNTKLPFGFNYKDNDYDITHDNDDQGEHGSHVAGIATANSWLYGGGDVFGKALEYAMMQGVAPDAQLLTMKVFGKGGSPYDSDYMAAIEDAIVLGADVVNLSLGSVAPGRGTHSNPVFEAIMDDLTKSGVVVAISAGNAGHWVENAENGGYLYNTDVSMDTVGQPGSFTNSLCVASVENDGMVGFYIEINGQKFVYNEDNRDGEFTNRLFREIAGEYEYIYIDGVGKAEDWAAVADVLPGKIALCSRGETNFAEKANLAIEAGAVAVFIYNNQSGIITLDLSEYLYTNPVAAITKNQGEGIRDQSTPVTDAEGNVLYRTGTMTISNTIALGYFGSEYYTMSDFSSWGVPGSLEMKPEITAPGGNIYSLNGLEPSGGGYEIMSGTSMASPQVAGMSALLAQYVRENGLVEKTGLSERQLIQSLLMSTAQPVMAAAGQYYPVLQQGAGLANVYSAIMADSYITMGAGTSAGAADGKVKVELFDDPQRIGSYQASFTVNNLYDVEKILNLNADFFIQAPISDGEQLYMDLTTTMISMNVKWLVNGHELMSEEMAGMDFNGDGQVNADDGQALLDYSVGALTQLNNADKADVDGDGDIDSHDAYTFLHELYSTSIILPAGGAVEVTVEFSLSEDMKEAIDTYYPNGTYLQGFLYAETVGLDGETVTSHSIPVLGFFGNWTDPSMFDVGAWTTFATGEDTRIPYIGRARGNDFKIEYDWDPGYSYSFGGNPLIPDDKYMPERNAVNSNDSIDGVSFIAIRHADQSRVTIVNETTGEVLVDQETGAVNMAYYYGALGWQNSGMTLTTNFSLNSANEGDKIAMDFTLVPEYYIDEAGNVDWDALGHGATIGTSFTIDNTAPELLNVSISLLDNTMTVRASDNQYVAAVGLYNKTGTRCLAQTGAKQDIAPGEEADYTFSLDQVNGKKFLLQVFDYAMNRTTYLIEMQIGEEAELPEMMAFDLVSRHWAGFTKDFVYDYKEGTPRVAFSDHMFYAATIAEHYVFASTDKGELYVMPEDDLTDTTYITDMEMVLYDMAYNESDGEIYAVNEIGELVRFHKLTGEVTKVGKIGLNTNTLACSPEGVFYCNELGTGKVYSFTLETMDQPQLLMEDPFLTAGDPITGADMGGTTGNMGMEYNPNTGKICWNSHCEALIGSYITFAYFYEIDPVTGEFTRYADFWHEMSGLIIPVRSGGDKGWAEPTDEVIAVKLNKEEVSVIRGTSTKLIPNVMPWTATDRTVTWTSADESIATVDHTGVITGVEEGTTTIRATSNLDPSMYAECTVHVEILDVTIHGTLSDAEGNSMFYDWDMSQLEGWKAGNLLHQTMTSATYSQKGFYYMMDATAKYEMHKVDAQGNVLESAANTNGIPLWDMTYNPYFSQVHGEERVSGIYYYYLLSPKNPMAMDAVGFNLGDLADYLVGITSKGYVQMSDEEGNLYDTEHLILLDNDGYIWDFWVYDMPGGGMNALFNITKTTLNLEFPGDDTMENMFTSLMVGDDGNLYLSAFNGATNEIFHMSYDEEGSQYVAVKIGEVGENVWPASITSVTVNGGVSGNSASPKPMYSMAATQITQEELAAASSKAQFAVTQQETDTKLGLVVYGEGTKDDPIAFVIGDNTGVAPNSGTDKFCYFTYTAETAGTATMTAEGTDWRAYLYVNDTDVTGQITDGSVYNPKNDGSTITYELQAGDVLVLRISPYKSYMYGGEITVNFQFDDGTTDPGTDPTPDPEPNPDEEGTLVLGSNSLASGSKYTYAVTEDGRLEFDFSNVKDQDGKTIYQYAYGKGNRLKIYINDVYAANLEDTKVSVSAGDVITVELVSVDGGTYTATLNLTALEPAVQLVLGENEIARNTDYSFIATQDGTLYTTIQELWCDGTYCSEASLSSSVVFRINGVTVYGFQNSYEVKAGDEITVLLGTQFSESASAVLHLSYEGFYVHPEGSRGNPYVLDYAMFPTIVDIAAGTSAWYKLTGFSSGSYIDIYGENVYVIIGDETYTVPAGGLRLPAVTNLQIGNSGSSDVTVQLYAGIYEGTSGNPQDLVEGDQTVELGKSENYYYDFVAPQAGTATFTVSGDNWRFFYSLIGADGTTLVSEEDHRATRGDAATVTVELATGQTILIKLATMTSSWTAPGGELTVNFQFTPAEGACIHSNTELRNAVAATCTEEGYTGDTYCVDCGELIAEGEIISAKGHNEVLRNAKSATCTEEGYTGDTYCAVCDLLLEEGTVIPAKGHEYQDGVCVNCGEEDPDAPKKEIVTVEVTLDQDVTNGIMNITWDAANMKLVNVVVHADYQSLVEGEGSLTVGYVSLHGIAAGETIVTLTFETFDAAVADVTVSHLEINNGEETTTLPGDANGDGEVNYMDAVMILQYYTEEEAEGIDLAAADFNGDGAVDYLDAIAILQYYVENEE